MERNAFVYSVTKKIAWWIFSVFYKIEVRQETGLPVRGPVILLPKHQYWTDSPIVSIAFKPMLYFVAKQELFRYPFFREYLLLLGLLPIDRKQSIRSLTSFRRLVALLKASERIVFFPEGTYVRKGIGAGKSRLIQMILGFQEEIGSRIPFVPVGIRYGKRKRGRRQVEVRIGAPLFAKKESEAAGLTERVMKEISRLMNADCGLRNKLAGED